MTLPRIAWSIAWWISFSSKSCVISPMSRDEDEGAHLRVEILQRVHELQHEARDVAHRVGHVAEHDDLRLVACFLRSKRILNGTPPYWRFFRSVSLTSNLPRRARVRRIDEHVACRRCASLRDGLLHAPDLVLGEIVEALLGERLQRAALALADVRCSSSPRTRRRIISCELLQAPVDEASHLLPARVRLPCRRARR